MKRIMIDKGETRLVEGEMVRATERETRQGEGAMRQATSVQVGWVIVCVVLIGGYLLPMKFAYGEGCEVVDRLLYPISHSGVLHLLPNLFCLVVVWGGIGCRVRVWRLVSVGLLVQFLGSYVTEMALPTLGASGWAYFLIGVELYLALLDVDLLRGGERVKRMEMVMMMLVVGIMVQGLFSFFNAGIHGVGLLGGVLFGRWMIK